MTLVADLQSFLISYGLPGAAVATLIVVLVEDLRHYRISNRAVLFLLLVFVLDAMLRGDLPRTIGNILFGLLMFMALLVAYRFRTMGGGDVKLLGAAFLSLGMQPSLFFTLVMSASALLYAAGAKLGFLPARIDERGLRIPFGPAIAAAWIATIFMIHAG